MSNTQFTDDLARPQHRMHDSSQPLPGAHARNADTTVDYSPTNLERHSELGQNVTTHSTNPGGVDRPNLPWNEQSLNMQDQPPSHATSDPNHADPSSYHSDPAHTGRATTTGAGEHKNASGMDKLVGKTQDMHDHPHSHGTSDPNYAGSSSYPSDPAHTSRTTTTGTGEHKNATGMDKFTGKTHDMQDQSHSHGSSDPSNTGSSSYPSNPAHTGRTTAAGTGEHKNVTGMDKLVGKTQEMAGKMLHKPALQEKGEQRRTGGDHI